MEAVAELFDDVGAIHHVRLRLQQRDHALGGSLGGLHVRKQPRHLTQWVEYIHGIIDEGRQRADGQRSLGVAYVRAALPQHVYDQQ